MKTRQYVKKYELETKTKFNHSNFAVDFGTEFMSLVEYHKEFPNWSENIFFDIMDEMRNKWEKIDLKAIEPLPEKLWQYMKKAIFLPILDEEFPELKRQKEKIRFKRIPELKNLLIRKLKLQRNEWGFRKSGFEYVEQSFFNWDQQYEKNMIGSLGLKPNNQYLEVEKLVETKNDHITWFIFDELTYQLKKVAAIKAKIQFNIYREHDTRKSNDKYDWYDFVSNTISFDPREYLMYFEFFKLDMETATEEKLKAAYRPLLHKFHQDKGGSQEKTMEIIEAKEKCMQYFKMKRPKEVEVL